METIKGINKLLKKLEKLGEGVRGDIDQITEGVASEMALDAKSRAPSDQGKLKQSIISRKTDDLTYEVIVGERYGAFVEFGTGTKVEVPPEFQDMASRFKGGNQGTFDEGLQSIKDWAKRQGIPEEAAYPIFISILKKGITAQPFLYPAYVQGREQYLKELKKLLKELTK